ncbi:hypothetical protein [Granulicella arctica]|uniref:hypothetical protein n=1 Tax=Granulicella arctica TaxID=940613 RepID=UPI0021DF5B5C|nr:hypothetical protein [Granulicella arctica]
MKTGTALATTLFAVASFPLLAQRPPPSTQSNNPASQQNAPATGSMPSRDTAVSPDASSGTEAAAAPMSSVNGKLVGTLDSKTAKSGDPVVVQTETPLKAADGTDIPLGSKFVGHVIGAQPSGAGQNSQVALQFDHLDLKGGQSMPVHLQIQSIAPAGTATTASASDAPGASATRTQSDGAPQGAGAPSASAAPENGVRAPGTIVATSGKIAIRTTSVPGVMLANNVPGQQDPRMAQASSILLGAKQDITLDGGTQMVLGVSAAGGATR